MRMSAVNGAGIGGTLAINPHVAADKKTLERGSVVVALEGAVRCEQDLSANMNSTTDHESTASSSHVNILKLQRFAKVTGTRSRPPGPGA